MFEVLIFAMAASVAATAASQALFADCPDSYTNFCFHGTCRYLVSEWQASCKCFNGYIGSRCQYVDLLQVMAGDPRPYSIVMVASFLIVLSIMGSAFFSIYLCRIKQERSRLALLKNMDGQGV